MALEEKKRWDSNLRSDLGSSICWLGDLGQEPFSLRTLVPSPIKREL